MKKKKIKISAAILHYIWYYSYYSYAVFHLHIIKYLYMLRETQALTLHMEEKDLIRLSFMFSFKVRLWNSAIHLTTDAHLRYIFIISLLGKLY